MEWLIPADELLLERRCYLTCTAWYRGGEEVTTGCAEGDVNGCCRRGFNWACTDDGKVHAELQKETVLDHF